MFEDKGSIMTYGNYSNQCGPFDYCEEPRWNNNNYVLVFRLIKFALLYIMSIITMIAGIIETAAVMMIATIDILIAHAIIVMTEDVKMIAMSKIHLEIAMKAVNAMIAVIGTNAIIAEEITDFKEALN